jgi:D-glycero-D-manno-heptose 1,7-bisphosphate phosphatase
MNTKAIFLDKDGTLIENEPYNVDPARVRLTAGAEGALRLLHAAGYGLVVVSNQSGVARGYFQEEELLPVRDRIAELLERAGVRLAGFYYCPHLPEAPIARYAHHCACRKPAPGLLFRAVAELGVDLARSWLVGDILDDVEAGSRAGCRTILLNNGGETEWRRAPLRTPDAIVPDLPAAARVILATGLAATPPPPDLTLCEAGS